MSQESVETPEAGRQEPGKGPAVQTTNLTKKYDARVRKITSAVEFRSFISLLGGKKAKTTLALDGVTLSIKQGEVFGLLGPNGAGKTTLIKILSTLVLPDSGFATVFGIDVVKHPREALRRLQTVLAENWGFERRLSGRQNMEFYATLYGIKRETARRRIDEILDLCQLGESADLMFQKYSTGMTRRLLVGRALLTDASVLLFDEPTTGLDPVSASDFRGFLVKTLVHDRGKTLLWATHNLWEAQNICDTIGVLNKGRVIANATPAELRSDIADTVHMSLTLTKGGAEIAKEELDPVSRVAGVTKVELRNLEPGVVVLDIEATRDLDYGRVFEDLTKAGLRIVELEASQPSLEEAFIRLTRGDKR